jgi:hypothetical protein
MISQTIINRIRASRDRDNREIGHFEAGMYKGRMWAEHYAEHSQLAHLGQVSQQYGDDPSGLIRGAPTPTRAGAIFFSMIDPVFGEFPESKDDVDFWNGILGNDDEGTISMIPSIEFVTGFAEGALFVWREVEPQL